MSTNAVVTIKDAASQTENIAVKERTESGVQVNIQEIVNVDPETRIPVDAPKASIFDDYSNTTHIYECEAAVGTASSAAAWRISRLTLATGRVEWAGGGQYTQIADNRVSLTYA